MTAGKNKGGHPTAPRNAAEVRLRISCEIFQRGREHRLRQLYRLLKAMERGEQQQRDDARIAAQSEANRLKFEEVELRRKEYLRRFAAAPLGQRMLLAKVERLESELAAIADSNQRAGDCACQ
jgi:hypothetical protein